MTVIAQSTAERQESLRKRRLSEGLTELRGIYLPPELHTDLKEVARKMREKAERQAKKRENS